MTDRTICDSMADESDNGRRGSSRKKERPTPSPPMRVGEWKKRWRLRRYETVIEAKEFVAEVHEPKKSPKQGAIGEHQ